MSNTTNRLDRTCGFPECDNPVLPGLRFCAPCCLDTEDDEACPYEGMTDTGRRFVEARCITLARGESLRSSSSVYERLRSSGW